MSSPPRAEHGPWPHLRAAFVALHVVAVLLAAAPAPVGGMQRSAWRDPTVRDELDAWAQRLRGLGMEQSDADFEQLLWELASTYTGLRRAALAPLQPYYEHLGTHQSWRMFVAPHRYPSRLHVDLRNDGGWRPLYVARDPDATWLGPLLDHDRMRSALFRYAWTPYAQARLHLGDWLARRAATDFPDATHLRLRYWKQRTPSPQEVLDGHEPPGAWIHERVVELDRYRGAVPP